MLNSLRTFIELLDLCTVLLVTNASDVIKGFVENFELSEFLNNLHRDGVLRFIVYISLVSCIIPAVMFVLFGIASLFITFTGFLFIEGTLLFVGGLCMFVSTAAVIAVLSAFALTSMTLYMLTLRLGVTLSRFSLNSDVVKSFAPAVQRQATKVSARLRPILAGGDR